MLYSLGILTTDTANAPNPGGTDLEIVAGAGRPMSILELRLVCLSTGGALNGTPVFARPTNTPAGGTVQTASAPLDLEAGGGASAGGVILSGWTTAPTAPSSPAGGILSTLRIDTPSTLSLELRQSWEPGDVVVHPTRSSGLVLWSPFTSGRPYVVTMVWEE